MSDGVRRLLVTADEDDDLALTGIQLQTCAVVNWLEARSTAGNPYRITMMGTVFEKDYGPVLDIVTHHRRDRDVVLQEILWEGGKEVYVTRHGDGAKGWNPEKE